MSKKLHKFKIAGTPVFVGPSALEELKSNLEGLFADKEALFILADENTIKLCFPILAKAVPKLSTAYKIIVKPGDDNKTLAACESIWNELAVAGGNRRSLLINLGGGMITDLGGFAAATFHRGMDYLNIPTSLLAMIDASLGGKTGIDLYSLKNQVGLFAPAVAVYVWPGFLNTLPHRQLTSGYAEMMKHALIADAGFWNQLIKIPMAVISNWEELILKAIEIKGTIVNKDLREHGVRARLNFGHTIGHAIETYSLRHDENPLTHGEAVAMGMICEAYISYRLIDFSHAQRDELVKQILLNFKHYKIPVEAIDELVEITNYDKKNEKGRLMLTLLKNIGNSVEGQKCETALVREALFRYTDFDRLAE
jgi:3-dehydroquinate synthase